jgi:hypothetical protein
MKKTLFIAMMALVMASCTKSPEQIAQQLIKDSFTEDPQAAQFYEPISFGTLDSVFTTIDDYELFNTAYDNYTDCKKAAENYEWEAKKASWDNDYRTQKQYLEWANETHDKAEKYRQEALSMKNTFKPEFKGWKMNHKFNVNNGIVVPFEVDIYFNKELTEVVGRGEVK